MQNLRPTIERGRPKIGLAFSGGTLRAIAQLGILEVFDEHRIPIDYIAAASSGCITAAAYACGTLQKLKETWFSLDNDKLKSLVGREGANGGIYHPIAIGPEIGLRKVRGRFMGWGSVGASVTESKTSIVPMTWLRLGISYRLFK